MCGFACGARGSARTAHVRAADSPAGWPGVLWTPSSALRQQPEGRRQRLPSRRRATTQPARAAAQRDACRVKCRMSSAKGSFSGVVVGLRSGVASGRTACALQAPL